MQAMMSMETRKQAKSILSGGSRKPVRGRGRAEKSAARRLAILEAALDEFSAQGFAATRIEDVARRAGVAKGTIYLHFHDKEALFQEIVRTMLGPIVSALEALRPGDQPVRPLIASFIDLFVREVYGTKRRNVLRLVMTEGPRFPKLAEFHYREVVERGIAAMRALIERALARGELKHEVLLRFPQLVVAPGIVAIIWSGLFERFAPLDVAGLMHAHLDILFDQESTS
jgi:AcrR family transcriptional regulator